LYTFSIKPPKIWCRRIENSIDEERRALMNFEIFATVMRLTFHVHAKAK